MSQYIPFLRHSKEISTFTRANNNHYINNLHHKIVPGAIFATGCRMTDINHHIEILVQKSQDLIELSVVGCELAEDESCLLLFSVVQDCAYKIIRQAKEELALHESGTA
jgi:hypothetical protein